MRHCTGDQGRPDPFVESPGDGPRQGQDSGQFAFAGRHRHGPVTQAETATRANSRHLARNRSIGSLRPVARFAPDPVLIRILPRCPGRPQGQRGRARSHRLAALPGRLGGCLRERDGGGGLSAVAVMHGCDAVAAIQAAGKSNQPRPAAAGARHPVPSSAVRDWFAGPSGVQENSRAGSAALASHLGGNQLSPLSFVSMRRALPRGRGGSFPRSGREQTGGVSLFFRPPFSRGFFFLHGTDNRAESPKGVRSKS